MAPNAVMASSRNSPDVNSVKGSSAMECLACRNQNGNRVFTAREMMFGFQDSFEYSECSTCGSLQIVKAPDDLSKYYSEGYYSFTPCEEHIARRYLKSRRNEYAGGHRTVVGALLFWLFGPPQFADWIQTAEVKCEDAVLDVGCGAGYHLAELRSAGFKNLTGIDPFLPDDLQLKGVRFFKKRLEELEGEYDFIMLHHSFEHMSNPLEVLYELHRLLKPGRWALVRCPVAGSYAYRKYGANWVQLDPPRHLFIPSRVGFDHLARASGFELCKVTCDSTEFQFEGSELYQLGIPRHSPRRDGFFSSSKMREFRRWAARLNQALDGDSACFYIRKSR